MHIFYINLARRSDRRVFMGEQFARLGLAATRIEAVTPDEISPANRAAFCDARRMRWLSPAALACTLSHLRAMEALRLSGAPHALILEDDVVLSSHLPELLAAFDRTPPALDVLRLETSLKTLRTLADGPPLGGVDVARFVGWQGGAAAYIITRHGAEIIDSDMRSRRRFFDLVFFSSSGPLFRRLAVRQAVPGLAIQTQCLPSADRAVLASDLDMAAFERREEAPYRVRHAVRRALDAIHRDTVLGLRKAWFVHMKGALRHRVPFLP